PVMGSVDRHRRWALGWTGMEQDDELWPPFGPAAAAREHPARRRAEAEARGRESHRDRHDGRSARHDSQSGAHDRARGRSRTTSAGLSRDEIVDVAIAIADSDGAEAVSMRRIAQVLRSGVMSLYWHLANKEHLLELMQDALMADVQVPEP